MKKGYIIASVNVSDPEAYSTYAQASAIALKANQGIALAKGGQQQILEGMAGARSVILEFPSYALAVAYYQSIEYQTAKGHRLNAAVANIIAVEGS
ncbi:hypothetical protein PSE10B_46710 [Pseudomonas amygdali pv. eriobotryae]|uniref:DUF1330 domain-containing protein n=1 Tax=Pseudomonas amygdali pv. eriobotryae TaxID=129137 RepID=A0A108WWZ6_PSEA0|nr:DUF1330 domain-containing protein [Pseudomonas amygdali]KWS78362.1 hypothetical protein AL052_01125 [Pseudomonas amygdali pv. eriobotryae]RMO48399.1 hypothetical protein ALQ39_00588 [Pseudomonas amygdali pv. eriobotryae]GFZ62803.1 hypothetical protein PSE10A_53140 [Pseudomonas amygdali pv. eriobotryae]GFZ68149.1 hypothetical protein PSE10B_46710 [Pseudomonas amygdali pv. eriobotryae]GFZ73861.1 hypothetical protein PSE10C_46030 [Pseudomonas amygdali pv. eriobotryae]